MLYNLFSKKLPLRPPEERQYKTVCWNPAEPQESVELTSHCASNLSASFRFEVWAPIAICGYKGVAARMHSHRLFPCVLGFGRTTTRLPISLL